MSALMAAALIGLMSFWVQEAALLLLWMGAAGVGLAAVLLLLARRQD